MMLYTKCGFCDGTRKTDRPITKSGGGVIPAGSECPLCKDGYEAVGMTDHQLERLRDRLESLFLFTDTIKNHEVPNINQWLAIQEQAAKLVPNGAEVEDIRQRKRM